MAGVHPSAVLAIALKQLRRSVLSPINARTAEGELEPAKRAIRTLHDAIHEEQTMWAAPTIVRDAEGRIEL